MLILGNGVPLIPITREVFGEDGTRILHGNVTPFSFGGAFGERDGVCLAVREVFFVHPELLEKLFPEWEMGKEVDVILEVGGKNVVLRLCEEARQLPSVFCPPMIVPPECVFFRAVDWDKWRVLSFIKDQRRLGHITQERADELAPHVRIMFGRNDHIGHVIFKGDKYLANEFVRQERIRISTGAVREDATEPS